MPGIDQHRKLRSQGGEAAKEEEHDTVPSPINQSMFRSRTGELDVRDLCLLHGEIVRSRSRTFARRSCGSAHAVSSARLIPGHARAAKYRRWGFHREFCQSCPKKPRQDADVPNRTRVLSRAVILKIGSDDSDKSKSRKRPAGSASYRSNRE